MKLMLKCKEFRLRIDLASTCAKQPLSDLFSQHPSNILEIHFPCIQLMGGDGSWLIPAFSLSFLKPRSIETFGTPRWKLLGLGSQAGDPTCSRPDVCLSQDPAEIPELVANFSHNLLHQEPQESELVASS